MELPENSNRNLDGDAVVNTVSSKQEDVSDLSVWTPHSFLHEFPGVMTVVMHMFCLGVLC